MLKHLFHGPGSARRVAAEALRLRDWAQARLMRGVSVPAPEASAAAWQLFLRQERCASLLQDSLRRDSPEPPLTPDAIRVLAQAVSMEMRLLLSARAHLRTIARVAAEQGWKIVVLKGTADVAAGLNVPIMDVDVWAEPEVGRSLAERLDAAGFAAQSHGQSFHLAPRTMLGTVQVEVHRAVTGFPEPADVPVQRARPIPTLAPLLRLAPEDHAWTVLCQVVMKHPERRTRIRDLLLLREALGACDAAGLERLDARVHASRHGAQLRGMIDDARDGDSSMPSERLYLFLARASDSPDESWLAELMRRARNVSISGLAAEWRRSVEIRRYSHRRRAWGWLTAPATHAAACVLALLLTADLALVRRAREWELGR